MYDISYKDMPRWQADDKAINDLQHYVGDKAFIALREEADKITDKKGWGDINHSLAFIGVRGYPVHAFGRRYCLAAYRDWMHSGDDAVATDDHGYQMKA